MTKKSKSMPNLAKLVPDPSWAFADLTRSHRCYISHGYYTYPAKFIPQLAARLIREFSREGDVVVDPFMGSGTTVLEAIVHGRLGVGVDVNPVAHLIAHVKATPLQPEAVRRVYDQLAEELQSTTRVRVALPKHERIAYWFPIDQRKRLAFLLKRIGKIRPTALRDFFLVAFAQVLKSCSIWSQRMVKPMRDLQKKPADPFAAFLRHARYMLRQNEAFWETVPQRVRQSKSMRDIRVIECADARRLPVKDGAAALVVTSPPYVTSYEYADLHQLAALWFEFYESLPEFRRRFIGTAHSERSRIDLASPIAERICAELGETKKSREVRNYFADLLECFREMRRTLKRGGKACIVIGNTELQGVKILNAEVFLQQLQSLGFGIHRIIKREIPSKMLPQVRDPDSGKFTSAASRTKVLAYPVEYILVVERK
jgi:DNA modification methylase